MDLGLNNKVALVAAASRGLGRAVAEELAREGASLVICSRKQETIERVANEIAKSSGAKVFGFAADVSNPNDVERLVQSAIDRFGRIDILVTNSGGPPAGPFEAFDMDQWEAATRLLLYSSVNLARAVLPGMKERRWGRILNITSIAVKQPVDNLILSNSLRAGVTGFARTLANEVAQFGITVNNIMPGYTRTERVEELAKMLAEKQGITSEEFIARWEQEIPMHRIGDPREFAALATFLVSERASFITGTSIPVDGGWIRSLI
ncbi:MAG TPA: SDR family oxidoreductase [Pyrinomonadaceae bacterium]|jgi:3-oxoacyl-[acyl-carrier protein] reductase|nr:SDR family oxidoreductase [Pyrinomonadaceae bacterium]